MGLSNAAEAPAETDSDTGTTESAEKGLRRLQCGYGHELGTDRVDVAHVFRSRLLRC